MIGETINNYRIVSLLGAGGMGSVYLAEHPFMGRKAAIKVLRREFAEDLGLVERFMNEARAANAIRHPNIIDIIDVGRMPSSGIPYLMMEFLEGISLAGRIAEVGRVEVTRAVDILVQTASALTAAHSKGIVHRDLKPDNLFLCPDESAPGGERVKVLDFGIAKLRGELGANSAKTQAGSVMGTPPYMSPEQCRGLTDDVDHRTDIYALGIILYEMLCGAPPFVSPGWGDVVLMHMTQEPAPPRSKNPEVPEAVERVILKALAKKADDRFASTADMRAALLPFSSSTTLRPRQTVATISPPTLVPRQTTFREATGEIAASVELSEGGSAKQSRRNLILLLGGAVVAAGATAVLAAFRSRRPDASAVVSRPPPVPFLAPPSRVAPVAAAPAPVRPDPSPVRPDPPPAQPRQVMVRLTSNPVGALVVEARTGVRLGITPLEHRLDAGSSPLDLRISKDGFRSAEISVPLERDFDQSIRLERRLIRATAAGGSSRPDKPATAARAASSAPAAASPPPVAAVPAAAAKPRTVDKW